MDSRFDPFRFHITEEQLHATPSRLDGVDAAVEYQQRIFGCELIQHAGIMLKLHQGNMATGQVLFHRFFYRKSLRKHSVEVVAMACLFLACKVSENPRKSRDVIQVFHRLKQRHVGLPAEPLDMNKPDFFDIKTDLVRTERAVLKELSFLVHVEHPYKYILNYLKVLDLESNKDVTQRAWNYINDSFRTNVCILYNPEVIATACIYLACRHLQLPLPESPTPWWELFDTTLIQILKICLAIEELYRQSKASYAPIPDAAATNGSIAAVVEATDGPATKKQRTSSDDFRQDVPEPGAKPQSRSRSRSASPRTSRTSSGSRDVGGGSGGRSRGDDRRPSTRDRGSEQRGESRKDRSSERDRDRDRRDRTDGKPRARDSRDDRSSSTKKDDKDTRPDSRRDRDRDSDDEQKSKPKPKKGDIIETIKARLKILEEDARRKAEDEQKKDAERYERAEREREDQSGGTTEDDRKRKRSSVDSGAETMPTKQPRGSLTQASPSAVQSPGTAASPPPSSQTGQSPRIPVPPQLSPVISVSETLATVSRSAPLSPPSDPAAAAAFIVSAAVSGSVLSLPLVEPILVPPAAQPPPGPPQPASASSQPAPRMLKLKRSPPRMTSSAASAGNAVAAPATPPRPASSDSARPQSRGSPPRRSTSPAFRPASGGSPSGAAAPARSSTVVTPASDSGSSSPQPVRRPRSPVRSPVARPQQQAPSRSPPPPARRGRSRSPGRARSPSRRSPSRRSPPSSSSGSRVRSPARSASSSSSSSGRPSSAPTRTASSTRDSYSGRDRDRDRDRDRRGAGGSSRR